MKSSKHSLLNRKIDYIKNVQTVLSAKSLTGRSLPFASGMLCKSVVTNKKKICPGCGRKTIMRLGYCRFCTSSMNHW